PARGGGRQPLGRCGQGAGPDPRVHRREPGAGPGRDRGGQRRPVLSPMSALQDSSLRSVPRVHRGKVRDIYALGDAHLLIVTTDRLSAFDVILPRPIPGKGAVLTAVTEFWMKRFAGIVPNHLAPDVRLAHYLKP